MFSIIHSALKAAIHWILNAAMLPFALLAHALGGVPVRAPPPPPPVLPDGEPADLPDPARRWAREARRWARRRMHGMTYEPDVPSPVRDWLETLDFESTAKLASLDISAVQGLLNGCPTAGARQSSSSSSASASASNRSARRARERQYSAASIHPHSRM